MISLGVVNLTNASCHINLGQPFSEYLRFEWLDKFYQYHSMLQGILLAQFIIFKVIRPVVCHWCCKGMHILQNLNGFTHDHGAFSALVYLLLVKGSKLKGYQHPSQPYVRMH